MRTLLVAFLAVMISGIGFAQESQAPAPAGDQPKVEAVKPVVKAAKAKHVKKVKKAEKKVEEKAPEAPVPAK